MSVFILLFSKYPCDYWVSWAFLVPQRVRNPLALRRPGFNQIPELGRSRGGGHGNLYSCLENSFHWHRNLVGYSPWGHQESGTAWQLNHHLVFLHICSLGGTALLRLPSEARLEVGMPCLACPLLGAAVLLFHSSGLGLVHLLLASCKRSL